ncbi:cyclic pyranopterin monophosphate synthase MoaC [Rhodanobacter sp. B2A1Ga4]|uniref:cyclic pyranopterin monophosphate synthase MoaC n=1 Tax=Rhodanobacter sp. B2A1Ga4 TaxID=2778647 RepID=UPI001B35AB87|nr:cyclic pyranopterin monophosphate synthase MoaC [Rhodanobacter sp. B2A1Ga4]MBQ4855870.1 cyclic pyranopterin monophosphate synthase MoaC [Rhodanobacter sp. B2A1Ga4]
MTDPQTMLSHVDDANQPRMVDVGAKPPTQRTSQARARVTFPAEVAAALHAAGYVTPKGAVLTVANIAGVMGAKATSQLIPLCHALSLDRCEIAIHMEGADALIVCTVSCRGSTGVEMEALTGASIAALTIYDMCKAMSHAIVIAEIRLLKKTGGKRDIDTTVQAQP